MIQSVLTHGLQNLLHILCFSLREVLPVLQKFADKIIDGNRPMRQMGVRGIRCPKLLYKPVVLIKFHTVCIRHGIDIPDKARRILPDVHGRSDFQHILFSLACVERCCQLRIPEQVKHAMIADPVTASKILVGIIIKHAPAKAPGDLLFPIIGIQNIRMTQEMLYPVLFAVKGFRWKHMPIVFTDQIPFRTVRRHILFLPASPVVSLMRKVIERIHILKQRTFLQVTHSTGLPHRIESVGSLIRPLIKCIVILGFVDAHAPQNN